MTDALLAGLHLLPGMTHALLGYLLGHDGRGCVQSVWDRLEDLLRKSTVPSQTQSAMLKGRDTTNLAVVEEQLWRHGIHVIVGEERPPALLTLDGGPALLYVQGDPALCRARCLSMVGPRKMSTYGKQVVEALVPHVVHAGLVTVSGLAYGVDAHVHRETLRAGGPTVAVVATGLDRCYPAAHRELVRQILEAGGAILSDHPLGTRPRSWHFVRRNQYIAALGEATVLVEAGLQSGALYTAEFTLAQGKRVYVVPGSVFASQMRGAHRLLASGLPGVVLLSLPSDMHELEVLHEVGWRTEPLGSEATGLLGCLDTSPRSTAELGRRLGIPLAELLAMLTALEIQGLAESVSGHWIRKIPRRT